MTTCTITGIYESPEAIEGRLLLTPDVDAVYTSTGIAVKERYVGAIDPLTGAFSVVVPATDSGTPTGWTYSVTEDFPGGRFYHISAPTGTFDLKQLAEAPESVGTSRVGILSVQPGTNVTVDDTDPLNPVVSATGGGGGGGGTGTVTQVNGQSPDGSGHVTVTYGQIGGTPTLGTASTHATGDFDAAGAATAAQAAAIVSANAHSDAATAALPTVAHTGAYADLSGKPTLGTAAAQATSAFDAAGAATAAVNALPTVARTGAYADLSGKPTLATVATTGSYTDLTSKPTLGTAAAQATSAFDAAGAATAAQSGAIASANSYTDTQIATRATTAQGTKADSALQPGGTITLPAIQTSTYQDVFLNDDGSSSSAWPNRMSFWFTPVGGSAARTFALNEFGEVRVAPGRGNTVAMRVFDRELATGPVHSGHVFEYMDNRTNRNVLFFIDTGGAFGSVAGMSATTGTFSGAVAAASVAATGTVTGSNIARAAAGTSLVTVSPAATAPTSPSVGDVWIQT